jgi:hypothetical protein
MTDALDALLDDLRAAASDAPAPVVGDALATLFREGAAPQAAPAPAPARRLGLRVLVATAVGGFTLGGLGVAGALPGSVQDAVAEVAEVVGVDLPGGEPLVPTTTTTTSSSSTTTTTTEAPQAFDDAPTTTVTEVPLQPVPTTVPGPSGAGLGRPDVPPGQEDDDTPGRSDEAPGHAEDDEDDEDDDDKDDDDEDEAEEDAEDDAEDASRGNGNGGKRAEAPGRSDARSPSLVVDLP